MQKWLHKGPLNHARKGPLTRRFKGPLAYGLMHGFPTWGAFAPRGTFAYSKGYI